MCSYFYVKQTNAWSQFQLISRSCSFTSMQSATCLSLSLREHKGYSNHLNESQYTLAFNSLNTFPETDASSEFHSFAVRTRKDLNKAFKWVAINDIRTDNSPNEKR